MNFYTLTYVQFPFTSARWKLLEYLVSFNPQNSNSAKLELEKPEKLVLLEPKLEILEQKSSLIHARTRQFKTQRNSYTLRSIILATLRVFSTKTQYFTPMFLKPGVEV